MTLEPGDVVLVTFPFSDFSATKVRPAIVISGKRYNARGSDVIVAGMTSRLENAANSVLLLRRDMAEGKLGQDSRVKADRILTLRQSLVRRRVGRAKPAIVSQVLKELNAILA